MNKKNTNLLTNLIILIFLVIVLPLTGYFTLDGQQKSEKTYRITVSYSNGIYDSINVDIINMIIPVTVKEKILTEGEFPTGYFFEMLDEKGGIVLSSNMDDPTISLLEYEDPEKPGNIKSQIVKHESGVFSFITSAPERARVIKFAHVIPGQEKISIESRRQELIGTFNLAQK